MLLVEYLYGFVHLTLLTHKCYKAEKYYQEWKSTKSNYQVRMCFADGVAKVFLKSRVIKSQRLVNETVNNYIMYLEL